MEPSRRVVRTYYALTALFTFAGALIWGVNTLVMLDAGLTIVEAFMANAAFTAAQVVFEIPTGVVADTRGRRFSFLLATVVLALASGAIVLLAQTGAALLWWLLANVALGLGFAFHSGATDAWFVDALHAHAPEADPAPTFARAAQVFGVATLVGALAGGGLGQLDLSLPWAARGFLLLALLAVAWRFMRDEGFAPRPFRLAKVPEEVAAVARASWRGGWMEPRVRLIMMLSFLHVGFLIWGWYAWQPHFLALLGTDAIWVAGAIAASVSVAMIGGNQVARLATDRVAPGTLILAASAGLAFAMLGVGLARTFPVAVGLFLSGMVCFGAVAPSKQAALHRLIPRAERATIASFDGLLASAGGVGSQVALAKIADARGYAAGYLVGGAALLAGIPLAWLLRRRLTPKR